MTDDLLAGIVLHPLFEKWFEAYISIENLGTSEELLIPITLMSELKVGICGELKRSRETISKERKVKKELLEFMASLFHKCDEYEIVGVRDCILGFMKRTGREYVLEKKEEAEK